MHEVELVADEASETVTVAKDESVLAASDERAETVTLDRSCRQGACTSCVGRVVEGDVDQPGATGLDPIQVEDGYTLFCVAEPTTDCRIEVNVQEKLFELV